MSNVLANLAKMTSETTGTGPIVLKDAVVGFLTFEGAGIADGDVVTYAIVEGSDREIGQGTYTSSTKQLTRTVYNSTNSGNPLDLLGTAEVAITPAKEDLVLLRSAAPVTATGNTTISLDGAHVVMANTSAATVTIAAGVTHCRVSRSAASTADVTVVSASAPTVTINDDATGVVLNAAVGPVEFVVDPGDANNFVAILPVIEV